MAAELGLLSPSAVQSTMLGSPASTPSRKTSSKSQSQQEEVIVWDDDTPSSSPFVTNVGDTSRQASKAWQTADPEIDAIFEKGTEETKQRDVVKDQFDSEEKENAEPVAIQPLERPSTPQKPLSDPAPATSLRTKDSFSMPPPSSTRRPGISSPNKHSYVAQTPLHARSDRAIPMSARSVAREQPSNIDDSTFAPDETGIDDTCFSTFSAVPDMTIFAKMGENRSPSKNQQVCMGRVSRSITVL